MKLNLPKITQAIPLADYAPELVHDDGSPAVVYAWVNPPAALVTRHRELARRGLAALEALKAADAEQQAHGAGEMTAIGGELAVLFAELWSQHADPATHWTAAEVTALANNDANPALYGWLTGRTIRQIQNYRAGLRKN